MNEEINLVQKQLDFVHITTHGLGNVNVALYGELHPNTILALREEGINLESVPSTLFDSFYDGVSLHVLSLGSAKFSLDDPKVDTMSYYSD